MSIKLSLAIAGVAGRMGRQLSAVGLDAGHKITGGSEHAASNDLSSDIGTLAGRTPLGLTPVGTVSEAAAIADIWIDFTRPEVTLQALDALKATPVKTVIIGTTGFTAAQDKAVAGYAARFAIVKAGNFSLGVAALSALVRHATERLGPDWDIEILETHHRHKIDAPSGTALMLGNAAADGRGSALAERQAPPYLGSDAARKTGEIGFSVRRSGGIIGEHDVSLTSETEQITLSHKALDRRVFANGAIKAAEWAASRGPGLYTIHDVLGL